MNNTFDMHCPSYDQVMSGTALVGQGGELALTGKGDRSARDYGHPIDANIIKILDMPIVNNVFKGIVDIMMDVSVGQKLASGVPVSADSFPEINEILEHCVKTLRIRRPETIITSSIGFNAGTAGSDESPVLMLGSVLVRALSREQLCFIIGHECGHIAMGHFMYHNAVSLMGSLSNALPLVGPVVYQASTFAIKAWSRRSEITADRAGFLCCNDLENSERTLMQLAMGMLRTEDTNIDAYIEHSQRYRKGGILRRFGEYSADHPLIPKRIQALQLFANSELYYRVTMQEPPQGVISSDELEKAVENLLRVL